MAKAPTNRLDYVMKQVIATKDNIEQLFAQYPTKRKIRVTQVRNLVNSLKAGKSFPVMYVNRGSTLTTKNLMLDGNHRLDALREYFVMFPDASVQLNIGVYTIDDPDLEREKFLELNNVVSPTSDDIIQQYAEDNIFLMRLLKEIDIVSIYGGAKKPLKVRQLMAAYIAAKNTNWTLRRNGQMKPQWSPGMAGGKTIIAHMENMDKHDMNNIKQFLKEYQESFGNLTKDSLWIKGTAMNAMFRIWQVNKEDFTPVDMRKRWQRLINHPDVIELAPQGGREASIRAGEKFVDVLNRGRGKDFLLHPPKPLGDEEMEEAPEIIVPEYDL